MSLSKKSKTISRTVLPGEIQLLLKQAVKATYPTVFRPMLASLAKGPFDEPGWVYEVKWDGYRAVVGINKGAVSISSRNEKSFNEQFYPLYDVFKCWKLNIVLDGEIVVIDEKGKSDFGKLQNWRSEADGHLIFYAFDILWLEGYDLTGLPLTQRKEILQLVLPENESVRFSQDLKTTGTEAFRAASKLGLEGLIAKKEDSIYQPGVRTRAWMKVKTQRRQEVVIGGYTVNDGTPKLFSSLLVGVYEDGRLHYIGKVGTGFTRKMQEAMMKDFHPLVTKKCPFTEVPDVNQPSRFRPNPPHATVVWLKPMLVGEVSFAELTRDGVMRHPSFEGMRTDKNAREVVLERAVDTTGTDEDIQEEQKDKIITPADNHTRKTLLNPKDATQVRTVAGKELKFTNLNKVFWPKDGVTKRDMLNYYFQIAPYILPYLNDRPLTLNRHPNGINGKNFYQKDVKGKVPDWMKTFPYRSEGDERDKEFLVCTDEASLLYVAALGCIEMNPWSSRIVSPDHPDWCIIDLDPDKNPFTQVIQAAQVTHDVLEEVGVPSCCKTSGSTGLHIYIPLGAKYTYEDSKEFARKIVKIVHERLPKFTSIERRVADRKGKIYLDFLQNRPQATVAGPYSLRPKPGATVSMPLHWEEVKEGLKMQDFTILNAMKRAEAEGDLFAPVLQKGINLEKVLQRIEELYEER